MAKTDKSKLIAVAGGVAAIGGIIFLISYFRKQKPGQQQQPGDPVTNAVSSVYSAIITFPLKKGSKNNYVKELQSALIGAYGTSILPAYGADGDWGSETDTAIKNKLGISEVKDKKQFESIIASLTAMKTASKVSGNVGW